MGDQYTIEFIDGSVVNGLLLQQERCNRYFFVDLTDAVVWAREYGSKREFEDHWSNAQGVKQLTRRLN